MTSLPAALGGPPTLHAWRLNKAKYADSWNSGIGARDAGGRWNSKGRAVVYASLDPSTPILETAVHAGFRHLDAIPHVLTRFEILDPSLVFVLQPEAIPNPRWLSSSLPTLDQQAFGDVLLAQHAFIAVPSAVSQESWNLVFDPDRAAGHYVLIEHKRFGLDPRLSPAP